MAFLAKIWLLPIALFLLTALGGELLGKQTWLLAIGSLSIVWLWLDIPLTVVYVIFRAFHRAKRDAQQPY